MERRAPYVKPMLTHLAFTADTAVNMDHSCKTNTSATGATPANCQFGDIEHPCSQATS